MAKNRAMAAKNAKVKQLSMKASKDRRYRGMQASYVFDDFADSVLWHMCHVPCYKDPNVKRGGIGMVW